MPDITTTVILLTYKRPDDLQKALACVLAQQPLPDEILVYDDDPAGSGRTAGGLDHPLVRYLCPGENVGPAGARTRAAEAARGDILFFLDDDCFLDGQDVIPRLQALFAEPEIGCVAVLIRNGYTQEIVPKEFPGYDPAQWATPQRVTYFLAGGFAIRRAAFFDLGGFDALLYHGEEEIDLAFRLLNAGWQIHYTPEILVWHYANPHGRETIRRSYRLIRNRFYLAAKHLPFPYWLSHLVVWGGFATLCALRAREFGEYLRGFTSLWREKLLHHALAYRTAHPMLPATLRYLRAHKGRLWY